MAWLGLDVGGANLKAATADGFACQAAFALWRRPTELAAAIGRLLGSCPPYTGLAVTMTGELADCFSTKVEGVAAIVAAVEEAAGAVPTAYYTFRKTERFFSSNAAADQWREVAAANWHALATACGRVVGRPALLIDIGSTTTDLIPCDISGPLTDARTDLERLAARQLLYQGVGRTPVCAVVGEAPYRRQTCPVAAELFATTADVALMLGHKKPSAEADSADGRPWSEGASITRLARMLCADQTEFNRRDAVALAGYVCEQMERKMGQALQVVLEEAEFAPECFVLAGEGAWLAESALMRVGRGEDVIPLAALIGEEASIAAPAWAVAALAGMEASMP